MLTLYFLALLSIVQYSFVKHRAVQPVFACSWQNWGLMTRASKKKRWHINSKVNYAIIHNKTIFFERETRDRERRPHFVVQASLEHSNAPPTQASWIMELKACTTTPGRTDQVSSIKDSVNQARWHPPVIPAFWEAKQEADTS